MMMYLCEPAAVVGIFRDIWKVFTQKTHFLLLKVDSLRNHNDDICNKVINVCMCFFLGKR